MTTPSNSDFYYKNNRLQKIRGFYHTAQLGSLTKAAAAIGLTQPAISMQIRALEQELQVKLFTRLGGVMKLTEEGIAFFTESVPIIKSIDRLFDEFPTHYHEKITETIRIAANHAALSYVLPPVIKQYNDAVPSMKCLIHHAHREQGLKLLREQAVDMFLSPRWTGLQEQPEFEYISFARFIPSLITLPSHPLAGKRMVSVQEIAAYDLCLCPPQYYAVPGLGDFFARHGIEKSMKLEFEQWETPRRFVETGIAISISSNIILDPVDSLVATPLLHYFPITDYGIVIMRGHSLPKRIILLIEMIKALYPAGVCANGLTIPLEELEPYL